jgi:hypothetical protein
MRVVVVLLFGCIGLMGQQPLPASVANIVDLARTAPPELFADSILKLIEKDAIPPGENRTKLLTEALDAAGRAQEPVRLKPVPGLPPDNRAIFRAKASELELDRLTLQMRIVKAISGSDAALARRWFESAGHPVLETPACEDPLIPDPSIYMETAGLIARTAFSVSEKTDGKQAEFLRSALETAKSPADVAAFVRALEPLTFAPMQWQLLLGALAAKMEAVAPDYRSFAISAGTMREPLEKIAAHAGEAKADTSVLARGFRRYLTNQMSAPRCDEDFGEGRPTVEWFNASFRGDLEPIADGEIEASRRLGTFQVESYFAAPDALRISQSFARLKAAPQPGAPAWTSLLSNFLREYAAWTPAGSDIDQFHQRLVVLRGLLELAPAGAERDQIIAEALNVLRTSRAETLFPAEWLLQVKALVEAAGPDSGRFLDAFRGSGDAGLALFAAMR